MGKTETLIFETFHGIPSTCVWGIHAKRSGGKQGGLSFDLLPIPAAACASTVGLWGTGLPETHEARESLLSAAIPLVPRAPVSSFGANSGQSFWKKDSEQGSFSPRQLFQQTWIPGLASNWQCCQCTEIPKSGF